MDFTYSRAGDYLIPNFQLPEENRRIGKWGRIHQTFLKQHHPIQYCSLVLSCNLWTYLADLEQQVYTRMETLMAQMISKEGITEERKARHPLLWTQKINCIRAQAEEIVCAEMIFV